MGTVEYQLLNEKEKVYPGMDLKNLALDGSWLPTVKSRS